MKKILIVILLSTAVFAHADMDRHGNPVLDPEAPPQVQAVQATDSLGDDASGIKLLSEVLNHIKKSYYKDINWSICVPALLKGGVSECTDRYSYYLDPVQASEEKEIFMNGTLAGIGASLELNKEGGAKVIEVYEGSPAEKAGLQADDVIIAVSSDTAITPSTTWTDIEGMPLDQTIKLIRGPKGTKICLMVIRNGEQKEFLATRATVVIRFLKSKMLSKKTGYIRIQSFAGDVAEQFYEAMKNLEKTGALSVIIDLRNNGGGKLNSVVDMCALFAKTRLPYATILYTKTRNGPFKDIRTMGPSVGKFQNMRVVVLQNKNSASASEIFSGYMKSEAGALIIGENSFGKGIVQSLIPLSNKGELHLTISEYFIGKELMKVHGIGIPPTIEIKQDKPAKTEKEDAQLQRAILEAEKLVK